MNASTRFVYGLLGKFQIRAILNYPDQFAQMAALRLLQRHSVRQILHHPKMQPTLHGINFERCFSKVSSIDAFVARLLQSKSNQSAKTDAPSQKPKKPTRIAIKWLDQNDLDSRVKQSIAHKDRGSVNVLIEEIVSSKQLPSDAKVIELLIYLCDKTSSSMTSIGQLISVCQNYNIALYATNLKFQPFLAQPMWQMQQFDDALKFLDSFFLAYKNKCPPIVRVNYQQIIFDAVQNQSDDILQKVIESAKDVFTKYGDPQLLLYIWNDCFCSDLHRNVVISEKLIDSIEVLRETVARDMMWIVTSLLAQHNLNAVHRLIQLCLKYEWKDKCSICLFELFDYECKPLNNLILFNNLKLTVIFVFSTDRRHDIRGMAEVLTTCDRLEIAVPAEQMQKMTRTILNTKKSKTTRKEKSHREFEFKF